MIDVNALENAFDDFEAKMKASGGSVGQPLPPSIDACSAWHNVRGTVDQIIVGLEAVGIIVPIARQAAEVLKTLKNLLNILCP